MSEQWCSEACKKSYGTKLDAATAAMRFHKKYGWIEMPYRCPSCRQWHLTTQGVPKGYDPFQKYVEENVKAHGTMKGKKTVRNIERQRHTKGNES